MTLLTLYRTSKIGDCLAEALDEMIMQEKIPGDLGMKVMAEVGAKVCTQALTVAWTSFTDCAASWRLELSFAGAYLTLSARNHEINSCYSAV